MTDQANEIRKTLAVDKAHDDFDRAHGFGLYHTSPGVQEENIAEAQKKIDKWIERLTPYFDAKNKALLAEVFDETDEHIEDHWGQSGRATAEYYNDALKEKF